MDLALRSADDPDDARTRQITDPDHVIEALLNEALVPSGANVEAVLGSKGDGPVLIAMSGMAHRTHRFEVSSAFSPRFVAYWRPEIVKNAEAAIAAVLRRSPGCGDVTLASTFAVPVAVASVGSFVGLPRDDVGERVVRLAAGFLDPLLSVRRRQIDALHISRAIASLIQKQDELDPSTLLGFLVSKQVPSEDIVTIAGTMLAAGSGVAPRALMATILYALQYSISATDLSPVSVDHALEAYPIVAWVEREATRETNFDCDGAPMEAGSRVHLRVDQSAKNRSLVFGHGAHYCIGAAWVRELSLSATKVLLARGSFEVEQTAISPTTSPLDIGGVTELAVKVLRGEI